MWVVQNKPTPNRTFGTSVKVRRATVPMVTDVILSRHKAGRAGAKHFKESAMSMTSITGTNAKAGFWTPWLTMGIVAVVAIVALQFLGGSINTLLSTVGNAV